MNKTHWWSNLFLSVGVTSITPTGTAEHWVKWPRSWSKVKQTLNKHIIFPSSQNKISARLGVGAIKSGINPSSSSNSINWALAISTGTGKSSGEGNCCCFNIVHTYCYSVVFNVFFIFILLFVNNMYVRRERTSNRSQIKANSDHALLTIWTLLFSTGTQLHLENNGSGRGWIGVQRSISWFV